MLILGEWVFLVSEVPLYPEGGKRGEGGGGGSGCRAEFAVLRRETSEERNRAMREEDRRERKAERSSITRPAVVTRGGFTIDDF